jgi:hypothetical protein
MWIDAPSVDTICMISICYCHWIPSVLPHLADIPEVMLLRRHAEAILAARMTLVAGTEEAKAPWLAGSELVAR